MNKKQSDYASLQFHNQIGLLFGVLLVQLGYWTFVVLDSICLEILNSLLLKPYLPLLFVKQM